MSEKKQDKVINMSDYKKSDMRIDKKKVDLRTLKELIKSGFYKPSADKIADAMLEKSADKKSPKKDK